MLKPLKTLLALSLCLSFPILPALAQNAQEHHVVLVKGQVINAQTLKPLHNVYIRQRNSLNAVFAKDDGSFEIGLHSAFPMELVFHAEGYETLYFRFTEPTQRVNIEMQPLVKYQSPLPPARTPIMEKDHGLFTNQFTAFYQGGYRSLSTSDLDIGGYTLNELGMSGDILLFKPLMFRGRFYRGRQPINIENFPFEPAFFTNTLFAKVGAGYVLTHSSNLETYFGSDLYFENRSPDNRSAQDQSPVPYTGSVMDFEQNRLALGFSAAAAWKLHPRLVLYPEVTLYPLGANFVRNEADNPIHYLVSGDIGLKARLEIIPGVYAVSQYNKQLSYGFSASSYFNNVDSLHIGLSLDPWTMSETLR